MLENTKTTDCLYLLITLLYSIPRPPQSILTVTFEVAGDLPEDALNVFIQVRSRRIIRPSTLFSCGHY